MCRSHSAVLCHLSYDPRKHCQFLIADCRFTSGREKPIRNRQLEIENVLAGMTRLELANQLIEGQSAFHFAFIPVGIADLRLPIGNLPLDQAAMLKTHQSEIGNWQLPMLFGTGGGIRTHTV